VSFLFGGQAYREADVLPTLRAAAKGEVPSDDRESVLDPMSWLHGWVTALAATPLRPALAGAVETLLASADPDELKLGARLQADHALASSTATSAALVAAVRAGQLDAAVKLATGLSGLSGRPDFVFDARLRDVALDARAAPLAGALLIVLGDHDRPWLVEHARALLSDDEGEAIVRAAYASMSLPGAELLAFADAVEQSLRRSGSPVADAVARSLRETARDR
jgi:hypothetical protein